MNLLATATGKFLSLVQKLWTLRLPCGTTWKTESEICHPLLRRAGESDNSVTTPARKSH